MKELKGSCYCPILAWKPMSNWDGKENLWKSVLAKHAMGRKQLEENEKKIIYVRMLFYKSWRFIIVHVNI